MADEGTLAATPEVVAEIRRGVTRLAHQLRLQRPAGGLAGGKLSVLVHLNSHGRTTPKQIADAERQKPQSLTRSLAELEAEGLIERVPNESDARSSFLVITAAGVAALRHDMGSRDAWLAAALSDLSEIDITVLRLGAQIMYRLA